MAIFRSGAGWLRAAASLWRGIRVHPAARVLGKAGAVAFGRGASVSARCVLRAEGAGRITIGDGVWLSHGVEMETETQVIIGARTTVQRRCSINGTSRLGRDCILAPDVFISSGTHPFRQIPHLAIREQERRLAAQGVSLDRPVWIQDDCWLGAHVVVSPGVTIGKGSVVGANSVVTRDVPPYSVVAGSPARVIGQRLPWQASARINPVLETDWPYVLSGVPATGKQRGIVAADGAPILIALRTPAAGEMLRIEARCAAAAGVRVNGQAHELRAGDNSLVVPVAAAEVLGASVRIEVDASASPGIVFSLFELVTQEPKL